MAMKPPEIGYPVGTFDGPLTLGSPGQTTTITIPNSKSSFDDFMEAVRSSVDGHAKRKNYSDNGADGHNRMLTVMKEMDIDVGHGIGEIVYKCAEYLRAPRRVLLEKVAGWAFCIWREHPDN